MCRPTLRCHSMWNEDNHGCRWSGRCAERTGSSERAVRFDNLGQNPSMRVFRALRHPSSLLSGTYIFIIGRLCRYHRLLDEIQVMPPNFEYRAVVEKYAKERLAVIQDSSLSVEQMEQKIQKGQVPKALHSLARR
jgi:hypothetical protein